MDSLKGTLIFVCICLTVFQAKATEWTIKVPSSVKGLPGSCVVIPCSYDYPDPKKTVTTFTGIWHDAKNQLVYHPVESKVMQKYHSRTELLGDIRHKNCSMKIDPLQESDSGPFHFRIEIENNNKYSYMRNTVTITMIHAMDPISFSMKKEVQEGQSVSASCSVSHSCPSSPPVFTWSHSGEAHDHPQQLQDGQWVAKSTLTFQATRADHNKSLKCTVRYKGGKEQEESKVLKVNYAPVKVKVEYKPDIKEGEDVQLTCSSNAQPPASQYVWHNGTGAELHHGKVFLLLNVSRHQPADIYCTAINTIGRGQSKPVQLSVLYAPVKVKVEYKPDIKEGEDVQLTCSSDAQPPASQYVWHNGTGAELHHGKVFLLLNVSRHQPADIHCTAINTIGRGQSKPVQLSVLYAPEIQTTSSCSVEAGVVKCVCTVESRPPSMVYFVLSDKVVPSTKEEHNGSVSTATLQAELGSSEFIFCLANNTQGSANLTLSLVFVNKIQSLYIIIAAGAGGILLIILIAVGIFKEWGRSRDAPTPHIGTRKEENDTKLSQYTTTQRKGTNYEDVDCSAIYSNDHVYGNIQAVFDHEIYANM